MIKLGDSIAPIGVAKDGEPCLSVSFKSGKTEVVPFGQIRVLPLAGGETDEATLTPAKGFDVGVGKGKSRTVTVEGGVVGLVIDTRGRPIVIPAEQPARVAKLQEWLRAFDLPIVEE